MIGLYFISKYCSDNACSLIFFETRKFKIIIIYKKKNSKTKVEVKENVTFITK